MGIERRRRGAVATRARGNLRVIAGSLKGRRLATPDWEGLRPTSDRLRETLFNIVGAEVVGARVLDGCAGTGAVGIEALSRGAATVTFVDTDSRSTALVAGNLAHCGRSEGCAIIRADLGSPSAWPSPATFDLIFLDPPYETDPVGIIERAVSALAPDGLLIVEHARRRRLPPATGPLRQVRLVTAGDSALALYRRAPAEGAAEPPLC
jgi:16S rRNA (guanine966-N2)-methyltransferase